MDRFNNKGMMLFPDPDSKPDAEKKDRLLVLREAFCPNGHSLMNKKVRFRSFPGLQVKVKTESGKEGLIVLSPIHKDKGRVELDLEVKSGEILEPSCPECGESLPVYDKCECGADLVAVYHTKDRSMGDVVVFCKRADCFNEVVQNGGEVLTQTHIESIHWYPHEQA